tara:strand:+ start:205 stop:417 length:213 start_codon:yes stop_codon:yes gene_type:complete
MEQIANPIGNSTAILIERIFWLGIGGFFGLAFITSLIRGLKQNKTTQSNVSVQHLEDLAKRAIQKNSDCN